VPEKYEVKFPLTAVTVQEPELVHRIVDVLGLPLEAVARLTASVIRVAHLPILAAERYGERLVGLIKSAEACVPPERRIAPAPSVAGPILENVKYLEDTNPLLDMYRTLLASAMDRERVDQAHPAFPELIRQLSADEALLMYLIAQKPQIEVEGVRSYYEEKGDNRKRQVLQDTWPRDQLMFPQNIEMYAARLKALQLVEVEVNIEYQQSRQTDERGEYRDHTSTLTTRLSSFGRMFAAACIPEEWEAAQRGQGER
jgi:hypothetical protein